MSMAGISSTGWAWPQLGRAEGCRLGRNAAAFPRQAQEVGVEAKARGARLLGVELGGDEVAARHDRGEPQALVLRLSQDDPGVLGARVVGVHEVEVRVVGDTLEDRVRSDERD